MKKVNIFILFLVIISIQFACTEEISHVLVRGQEIPFTDIVREDDGLYIVIQEKTLGSLGRLLGGEVQFDISKKNLQILLDGHVARLTLENLVIDDKRIPFQRVSFVQAGQWYVLLSALAKAFQASFVFDYDKNIWYMDPFIKEITIQSSEGKSQISVRSSISIQPDVTRLNNPERLVFDFPYTVLSPLITMPQLEQDTYISELHVAQFQSRPNVVRIVLTLSHPDVRWISESNEDNRETKISLVPLTSLTANVPLPKENANLGPSTLKSVEFESRIEGEKEVLVANFLLTAPASYTWHRLKSPDNRIYIDLENSFQGIHAYLVTRSELIKNIRNSQFQKEPIPITRIVFELGDSYRTKVEASEQGVRVSVIAEVEQVAEMQSGEGISGAISARLPAEVSPSSTVNGIVVVLDPGHGGSDPGAHGGTLVEKNLTLDIARRLRKRLQENGFKVVMTRDEDQDVLGYHGSAKAELQARVDVAVNAGAEIFVSLHINSSEASWPHGVATHWYKSKDLPLATVIQKFLSSGTGFMDRGTLRDRFYVLSHSSMPAVLVEMGFLSHSGDEAKLANPDFRDKLAEALRKGLVEYSSKRLYAH